jgi:hypothetical protein
MHTLLIVLIQRLRPREFENGGLERSLVLVEVRKVLVEPPESMQAPRRTSSIEFAPSLSLPLAPPPVAIPEETAANPPPIDWRRNALRSAEIVAGRSGGQGYRHFGPREAGKSSGDDSAPSIFPGAPSHRRGDVDGDAHGDPIVWVNRRCYITLDKPVQTARDWTQGQPGQFAPPELRCLPGSGSGQPDGALFEHIKKREEPPVPKAGTEMNPLPERDP